MDGLQITPLTEKDTFEALELLQKVFAGQEHFKLQRNVDWWRWKYEKSVFGKPIIKTAKTRDGVIVGVRSFWPWQLKLNGKTLKAFQPVDTAIDPAFRRKGLFTKMTKLALEEARQKQCSVLFNFPNDQSLAGYMNMGWKLVGKLGWSVKILKPMQTLTSLNSREPFQPVKLPQELRFRCSNIKQEENMDCVSPIATAYKPPNFYRWRYEEHPFFKYGIITENHEDEIIHLIFSINENSKRRELSIVDIIGSTICLEKAFRKLELVALSMNVAFIAAININEYNMKRRLLKRGFFSVKKKNFALLTLEPDLEEDLSAIRKWSLFGGIHDTL